MSDHDIKALSFTPEQTRIKAKIGRLVQEYIAPTATETDKSGTYPRHNVELLGRNGFLSMLVPQVQGQDAADFVAATLVLEALGKGCASTAMTVLMHTTTLPFISALVSQEQKETILKPILEGRHIGALAMSEPETGSRLWHMTGYAEERGSDFAVNSFKSFVTGSREVDFYLVPVRTNASAAPNDLSVFWIPSATRNIKPVGHWDAMGLKGSSSTPVQFEGCPVSRDWMVGAPGTGFSMLMAYVLPIYFVGLSAVYLGIAEGAYESAVAKVKSRQYGDTKSSGGEIETIQRYVGEMKTKLIQLRASVYRCARMINHTTKIFDVLKSADLLEDLLEQAQNDSFFVELAQLKIAATETAMDVANCAMQVSGGQSYKRGNPVERACRDTRAGSLMGPANDILKVIIGKRELGLPYPWDAAVANP